MARSAMSLLCGHGRLLIVLVLFAAASSGDAAGDTYDPAKCQPENYTCGGVSVRYPFYLSGAGEVLPEYGESYCGYPGLAVTCDGGTPVLLLDRDNYTVSGINYTTLAISLVDADVATGSCPVVDHNVTVLPAARLFFPTSTTAYLLFFLGCAVGPGAEGDPKPPPPPPPPTIKPITCGGADKRPRKSFVLPEDAVPPKDWYNVCQAVYRAPARRDALPADAHDPKWRDGGYVKTLREGFLVTWVRSSGSGECSRCEQSNGKCGFNHTGRFLGCLCADGRVESVGCSTISDSAAPPFGSTKRNATIIGAGVASGFSALLVAVVIAILFVRKRKQRKVNSSSKLLKNSCSGGTPRSTLGDVESSSFQDPQTTHLFSYEELEQATDSFNDSRELGDGGFGTVYKGFLRDGRVVAVKRLYNSNYRRVEQFVNEAAILSLLRHPNLVMFYGCTSSQSRELLLVYEFVPNGTVADHLHGHRAPERALSWPLRLKIAIESAAALTYLHAVEPPIVHRDVKTTNILLDADFHVKVADFGLSRLFPLDVTHVSTAPQGTPGYVDPEYHQCYQLTDKSDVYSFGVVLVELISSKPAVDITRQRNEINLAGMAISKIQKCQLEQLVDLDLGYDADPATRKMMTMVAELAFRCLQQNGEMRPPIKEVLEVLRGIQDGCVLDKDGSDKHMDDLQVAPFSPDTVHAPWESRSTTPNTSQ